MDGRSRAKCNVRRSLVQLIVPNLSINDFLLVLAAFLHEQKKLHFLEKR